jgi:hypothetical protein
VHNSNSRQWLCRITFGSQQQQQQRRWKEVLLAVLQGDRSAAAQRQRQQWMEQQGAHPACRTPAHSIAAAVAALYLFCSGAAVLFAMQWAPTCTVAAAVEVVHACLHAFSILTLLDLTSVAGSPCSCTYAQQHPEQTCLPSARLFVSGGTCCRLCCKRLASLYLRHLAVTHFCSYYVVSISCRVFLQASTFPPTHAKHG